MDAAQRGKIAGSKNEKKRLLVEALERSDIHQNTWSKNKTSIKQRFILKKRTPRLVRPPRRIHLLDSLCQAQRQIKCKPLISSSDDSAVPQSALISRRLAHIHKKLDSGQGRVRSGRTNLRTRDPVVILER